MRVNVDTEAHSDPRFARLGQMLGAPPAFAHDVGLARMTRVWAYCTKRTAYALEAWEVDGFIGAPDSMTLLVACKLASPDESGAYYIAGTKGRIEWYATATANGRKGGRPKRMVSESEPSSNPDHNHPVTHPGNHPQEKEEEDLSSSLDLALTRDPSAPSPRTAWALAVYQAFPRKEGKTPGLKRLAPQLKSEGDAAAARLAAENYAGHVKAEGRELAHVKLFSTWVGEWRDWVTPEATPASPRASPGASRFAPPALDLSGVPDLRALRGLP